MIHITHPFVLRFTKQSAVKIFMKYETQEQLISFYFKNILLVVREAALKFLLLMAGTVRATPYPPPPPPFKEKKIFFFFFFPF